MAADKAPVTSRRSAVVPVITPHDSNAIRRNFDILTKYFLDCPLPQVHITVKDENDNKPIFNQKIYHASVAENVQLNPPAAVLQVSANDADDGNFGEIKYSILSIDNTLFQLDPNSGILYPSRSLKGMEGQYKLKVEARDGLGAGPFTDEADVIVDVHRINNYRPVFTMPALSNTSFEVQEVTTQKNQENV